MGDSILSALAGALVASAGAVWVVGRQLAALKATVQATFDGLEARLTEHQSVHVELNSRVGRVEARLMGQGL